MPLFLFVWPLHCGADACRGLQAEQLHGGGDGHHVSVQQQHLSVAQQAQRLETTKAELGKY